MIAEARDGGDVCGLAWVISELAAERGDGLVNRVGRDAGEQVVDGDDLAGAIGVGGGIAGALDLTQACVLFGKDIPLAFAGGLLGKQAFAGGAGTYALGVALHFYCVVGGGDLLRC